MRNSEDKRTAGFKNSKQQKLKKEKVSNEILACIKNHQQACTYFTLAAKYNYEAARYYDDGEPEKAGKIAVIAIGYTNLGAQCQHQDTMNYALNHEK